MLAFFVVSVGVLVSRDVRAGLGLYHLGDDVSQSLFWLVWFEVQAVLGVVASRGRADIENDPGARLPVQTRILAIVGLALLAMFGKDVHNVAFWFAWFAGLALLLGMEAKWGVLRSSALLDHPTIAGERLGLGRTIVAVVTLVFFALLFMPVPIRM